MDTQLLQLGELRESISQHAGSVIASEENSNRKLEAAEVPVGQVLRSNPSTILHLEGSLDRMIQSSGTASSAPQVLQRTRVEPSLSAAAQAPNTS